MREDPPPPLQLLELTSVAYFVSNAILAAVKLGLAGALHNGPRSVAELAPAVGADAAALGRLLRALGSVGVFSVEEDGRYGLTPMSQLLLDDTRGSMAPLLRYAGAEWHHRMWGDLAECVRTGKPASERVLGAPLFDYLGQHPADGEVFNAAMRSFSVQAAAALLGAYDLSAAKKLVDVGGGHGQLVAMALSRYPALRGAVFDLPHVVAGAAPILEAAGVAGRVDLVGGDFFTGDLPADGDVYTLMNIVHDWSDDDAVRILERCRAAMRPDARLLLVEMVLTEGASPHFGKLFDLEMLVLFGGGRERTENELRALCARGGLRVTRVLPTESPSSVVEAVPA
jgi:hypothetical protein